MWYYTPFYAMLRAATYPLFGLDAKFWGFVVMAGAIALPAVLPWLDRSPVKSIRYKGAMSQGDAGAIRHQLLHPRLSRHDSAVEVRHAAGADLHGALLRLFRADALVHARRKDQAGTGSGDDAMKRSTWLLACSSLPAIAVTHRRASGWKMQPFHPNLQDKPSLQRGVRLFVNYCMGCHSLKFQRYERTADDLEIPHDIAMANLDIHWSEDRRA